MIIELYGLPGSGKSTIIQNLFTINPSKRLINFSQHNARLMGSVKGKVGYFLFLLTNAGKIKQLKRSFAVNDAERKAFNSRFNQLMLLLYSIANFDRNRAKNEVLLMDQGIIQAIGSIFILLDNREQLNVSEIFRSCVDLIGVAENYQYAYIQTRREVAFARIHSRNKKNCEFRMMSEETLNRTLGRYEKFFTHLTPACTLDSSADPGINANLLSERLTNE